MFFDPLARPIYSSLSVDQKSKPNQDKTRQAKPRQAKRRQETRQDKAKEREEGGGRRERAAL